MEWSEKISNKKYLVGTAFALLLALYAGRSSWLGVGILAGVVLASVLNQWLMFVVLGKLLSNMTEDMTPLSRGQKLVLWGQIALKFSLLGAVFYFLISEARHLVAQGLLLYTFQLIILVLSIKNIGAFLKKGSPE